MVCFLKPLFYPVSGIFTSKNKFDAKTWGG